MITLTIKKGEEILIDWVIDPVEALRICAKLVRDDDAVGPLDIPETAPDASEIKKTEEQGKREGGVWTCCGRKGYKHGKNCNYAFGGKSIPPEEPTSKPCCGALGFRHKKGCKQSYESSPSVYKPKNIRGPEELEEEEVDLVITEGDFNDIKDAQHNEMTSVQAGSELNLDTIACIRAFQCRTWEDYKRLTRKQAKQ